MSSFHDCQKIEAKSYDILSKYAKEVHYFDLDKVEDLDSQYDGIGDALLYTYQGKRYVELKCEMKHTGNLFIEEYSNKLSGRLGWFYTSKAELIWYYFLDVDICYSLDFASLRKWMRDNSVRCRNVEQSKHKQRNLTTGWLVPVESLLSCGIAGKYFPLKRLAFASAE